ncbi:hypothetical protein KAR91_71960 [Candidatus Pacearchaeota archaeon]|nr:hypothetical protein [Candidatus Pacearchaeota archaeon]
MIDYSKLKIGDILLTKKINRPIIDKLIWFFQKIRKKPVKGPAVTHSVAYLGDHEMIEAWAFGIKATRKNLTQDFFKDYNVYVLRAKADFDRVKWRRDCIAEIGVKYAYKQIFYIAYRKIARLLHVKALMKIFKKPKHKKGKDIQDDAYTCSEYLSFIFKKHGIKIHSKKVDAMVFPIDIYESKAFKKVMRNIVK